MVGDQQAELQALSVPRLEVEVQPGVERGVLVRAFGPIPIEGEEGQPVVGGAVNLLFDNRQRIVLPAPDGFTVEELLAQARRQVRRAGGPAVEVVGAGADGGGRGGLAWKPRPA